MIILPDINPEKAVKKIEQFILEQCEFNNKKGIVLGISGGIDSAIVAAIAKRAFLNTKLQIKPLFMPAEFSSKEDKEHVNLLAEFLKINLEEINISDIIKEFDTSIFSGQLEKGNLTATIRATILAGVASKFNLLVAGTGNRDEYWLGYFTKRGDGSCDIFPILALSKRQVYTIARYLNIPQEIINAKPSAGLTKGQTDEEDFGFTYSQAEIIINGLEQGFTPTEIHRITKIPNKIIEAVIIRHNLTKHKREKPPYPELVSSSTLDSCTKALVIGRFQMIHIGHEDMFNQLKELDIKEIFVGVGSKGNTLLPRHRYLFTFEEVKSMLTPLLENLGIKYKIIEIPDVNDSLIYAKHVESLLPIDKKTFVFSGSIATLKCFQGKYVLKKPESRINVHSSRIRELIIEDKPYAHLVYSKEQMDKIGYEKRIKKFYLKKDDRLL